MVGLSTVVLLTREKVCCDLDLQVSQQMEIFWARSVSKGKETKDLRA